MKNPHGYDEQRLIDEVIYLHSLWHQGPPPPANPLPTPIPIPIPVPFQTPNFNVPSSSSSSSCEPYIPQPLAVHFHPASPWHLHSHQPHHTINPIPIQRPLAPAHTRSLPPTTSTPFKKKNKNKKKIKRRDPISQPDPGLEWPCPVTPEPPSTDWGTSKPRSTAPHTAVSSQEKERLSALQAQNKASQAFREFLIDSDDDGDDEDEVDDDDDDDGLEEIQEFFVEIFMEDDELRGYYHRCFENGEFCCLVCGAIGKKKSGKRYKDCVGLVQHSMSISRTVKRRAHRAFGQAVCKVLGWDIDRLPTIVMKGVPLGGMKKSVAEGEAKENAHDDGDGRDNSHKSDAKVVSLENNDELVEKHAQEADQGIGQCSSKESGDLDEKMLDIGLENGAGGAIDEHEPKEKVDHDGDGGDGPHRSDDKVVSLEHGDEQVEEHARGVHHSISECSAKEGDINHNTENLNEKMDIGLENGGGRAIDEVCNESLVSGAELVCRSPNCDSSSTASGWPSFNTESSSQTCAVSAETQASVAVLQMQQKALVACEEYLVGNAGSDSNDDNNDEDEDQLIDYSDPEECEEFNFFLRLFSEDSGLRRYYEDNYREGDFYCLVCGVLGKKIWRRFKDCIALLQHSTAIKKTERKRAHRAYSQVICKVLGWDIDRLPAIVLKGESLGSSLAGSRKLSVEHEKPADSRIDDSNGEREKPADCHIDDSNVLQKNQAK